MEVTTIKDLGIKYTTLPRGRYVIDGEGVELTGTTNLTFKDSIQRITETKVKSHYENGDREILHVDEYEVGLRTYTGKGIYEDYQWEFDNLDDEYAYKKFCATWTPIYNVVDIVSEVVPTKLAEIVLDTGNPLITPMFAIGNNCSELYELDRVTAQWNSIKNKFDSIGFDYVPDADYKSTGLSKIYGGKEALYVTAFGIYIFGDRIRKQSVFRGTLEQCIRTYHSDKEEVESRIGELYQRHYATFNEQKVDYKKILSELEVAMGVLRNLDVKKSGEATLRALISRVFDIVNLVKVGFDKE
jgi:hypothetical protein